MKRMTHIILAVALVAILAIGFSTTTSAQTELGPITSAIIERGELNCGANNTVRGFGFQNEAGEWVGFDVDFCRAVAAAVLGDANAVNFRFVGAGERQAVMQSGEVDLMVRNTTWTLSRDVTWGVIFGPTTFFDAQGIGTRAEYGFTSIADLDGTTMCVQSGTTTELNITDYIDENGLDIQLAVFDGANPTWEGFLGGACESWTTDKSGIVSFHLGADDPTQFVIFEENISKEPLGPLSPQNDPQFAEIIAWTHFGMVNAEEYGINSDNISEFLQAEGEGDQAYVDRVGAPIARLLGQGNNDSGSYLGIANDFMVNVISQVGNYGEVYARNLGEAIVREGTLNALALEGGAIYAPPFR